MMLALDLPNPAGGNASFAKIGDDLLGAVHTFQARSVALGNFLTHLKVPGDARRCACCVLCTVGGGGEAAGRGPAWGVLRCCWCLLLLMFARCVLVGVGCVVVDVAVVDAVVVAVAVGGGC
eukprot:575991-Alexandrium_andersonii.AAC.1